MINYNSINAIGKQRRKSKKVRMDIINNGPTPLIEREGMHIRMVADNPSKPGRIRKLAEVGYTVVMKNDEDERSGKITDAEKPGSAITYPGGHGVTMVAMEIPLEIKKQNDETKSQVNRKKMQSYNGGAPAPRTNEEISRLEKNHGGFYGGSLTYG